MQITSRSYSGTGSHFARKARMFALLVSIILAGFSLYSAETTTPVKESSELDKLYQVYLDGTIEQARRALLQSIALLEKESDKKAVAHAQWLNYSRLHVLEERAENHALAEASLLKARYWFLRKLELSGEPTEKAMEIVRGFTGPKCAEIVDQFDRDHTDKKGPKYVRPPL